MSKKFRLWKISPWSKGKGWDEWKEENIIEMGHWDEESLSLNLINEYGTPENFYEKLNIDRDVEDVESPKKEVQVKNFVWGIKEGDILLAFKHGEIVGVTRMQGENEQNYDYNGENHIKKTEEWHELKNPLNVEKTSFLKEFFKGSRTNNTIYPLDKIEGEIIDLIRKTNPEVMDLFQNINPIFESDKKDDTSYLNSLLFNKKQIIFYGPPGTGKTYKAREFSVNVIENHLRRNKVGR